MCEEPVNFLIFCIEEYKLAHNLTGGEVFDLFDKYGVTGFILKFHDVLHIEGAKSIIVQIDDYIANHGGDICTENQ